MSRELTIDTAPVFKPLLHPARYKGVHGGRGSAKSHFFAELLVERNIYEKLDCVCLREVLKSLEFSVKKLIEQKIADLGVQNYFTIRDRRILTKHGGVIIFEGMQNHTADSIKSLEGFDVSWFEEAQAASQKSLDLLRPTIRKEGSELWFSWNPEHSTDPIDDLLRGDKLPPGAVVVESNYSDNPWFPEELRLEMEFDKERDLEKYRHVWLGQYRTSAEEQVMHNVWTVQETPEPPPGTILRFGLDFGFSSDPLAANRMWTQGNTLYIDYEAHGYKVDIDDTKELLVNSIPGIDSWPIKADSARPDSISYLNKNGLRVVPARKGKGSIEDGIARVRGFDVVIHPRCKYTIEEFTKYSYKKDPHTDHVLPIIVDDWNHHIDEIRYATEGLAGENTVFIPFLRIHGAVERETEVPHGTPKLFGVYQNVICRRHGRKVEEMHHGDSHEPMDAAAFIAGKINEFKPDAIMINESGTGGMIADKLKHLGFRILTVNSFDDASNKNQWPDKLSEMWGRGREWLRGGDIPGEPRLTNDLISQTYHRNKKNMHQIDQSKEISDWPDYGMAFVTTFAYATPPVRTYSQEDLTPEWAEDM